MQVFLQAQSCSKRLLRTDVISLNPTIIAGLKLARPRGVAEQGWGFTQEAFTIR